MKTNKKIISMYVDAELKEQLIKEATDRHMALNTYLKIILYDRDKIVNTDKK